MNLTLQHLAPDRRRPTRAGWSTYQVDGHLPGHVVPGDARRAQRAADRRGRGAGRLRPRLPRGHLRHVRPDDQRRRRTARERGTTTCQLHMRQLQGRRDDRHRAVAGRRLPGDQGPGGRPRRLRPDHPGRRLHLRATPAAPRTRTPSRCPRPTPSAPSTPPPASAAAPASRPARTARRCCSPRAKVTHLGVLPQGQPERTRRVVGMVDAAGRRGLRRLHQHRRVHGGLPEGHPARPPSAG